LEAEPWAGKPKPPGTMATVPQEALVRILKNEE